MSNDDSRSMKWSRREVLQLAGKAMVGGVAAMSLPGTLRAQGEGPMKLGMMHAKQGTLTLHGEQMVNGARIALDEVGNKLLGRNIEMVWYDDSNPQSAQQNIQKMIDEDKVFAVLGGSNSASALAMSAVARRSKIPFMTPTAANALTGSECNPYTFRNMYTYPVACRAIAPSLLSVGKRWHYLLANYVSGQDIYDAISPSLKAVNGTEVGIDKYTLGATDFSSYILKIRQTKPDVVVTALPGGDLSTFLKQWAEMGMKNKIAIACPIIGDSDLWAAGAEAATGYYGVPWHFSTADNPPQDKAFAKAYLAKHGQPAPDKAWLGWFQVRAYIAAINQAKSFKAADIVRALETVKIDDGPTPVTYRPWDHQMIRKLTIFKVKDKITDKFDWLDPVSTEPKNTTDLDKMFGTKAEIGCKMESF
jgi:branched-chain amino acid transport system substrate-binding protein